MFKSIQNQIGVLLLLGYGWIFYALFQEAAHSQEGGVSVCIVKNVSGYPCVGCGSTRAILLFLNGHFEESIIMNPIGILLLILMFITTVLLMVDVLLKRQYLTEIYYYINNILLKNPYILSVIGLLIISNWVWNIFKMN